ncbi:SWIRM domain-containing protein [Meyerozyma sp. JA9]|nr:SWIRM domain-containing protein [Meyerozyma sp. JA9]
MSRTVNSRGASGCLTPHQAELKQNFNRKSETLSTPSDSNSATTTTILSPPLSPYQRSNDTIDDDNDYLNEESTKKSYVPSSQPFKVENYKEYKMVVNPWSNLDRHYKSRHLDFLEQYSTMSAREMVSSSSRLVEARRRRRRAPLAFGGSDSDSESGLDRVRTRRVAKESSVTPSDKDDLSSFPPSTPRRKKPRKEASYAGSPLALQQAALIDENIPDYSPSLETLSKANNRSLKVEWKGQPMDLRGDPNVDKLHPAEVVLASTLRLPCNVYLDSKRRLFYEKVSRMRGGMQFRRTDAQKACRIDVNKASRLFAAFEKVGWLDDSLFVKYL